MKQLLPSRDVSSTTLALQVTGTTAITSIKERQSYVSGTLQSYNFAGGQQLVGQNYKNCIRQEEGYCCIQYSVISYNMGGGAGDAIMICTIGGNAGANRCSGASLCISEMIIIPGGSSNTAGTSPPTGENYDRLKYLNKFDPCPFYPVWLYGP